MTTRLLSDSPGFRKVHIKRGRLYLTLEVWESRSHHDDGLRIWVAQGHVTTMSRDRAGSFPLIHRLGASYAGGDERWQTFIPASGLNAAIRDLANLGFREARTAFRRIRRSWAQEARRSRRDAAKLRQVALQQAAEDRDAATFVRLREPRLFWHLSQRESFAREAALDALAQVGAMNAASRYLN